MECYFFETKDIPDKILSRLSSYNRIILVPEKLSQQNTFIYSGAEIICVFSSLIDESMISKLPKLKIIVTRSTGVNHIDTKACKARKIKIINLIDYSSTSVAEFTFALILSITRRLLESRIFDINQNYNYSSLRGFNLQNKTLGVIGAGKIGKKVIDIASSFGMNILVYDRHFIPSRQNEKSVDIDFLISNSNIITLHLPLNNETHHILNKNLASCQAGTILINTSRADLIDQIYLLEYLKKGIIDAIGTDCISFKQEDLSTNKSLLKLNNFIYTPHIGFNTVESIENNIEQTLQIINTLI